MRMRASLSIVIVAVPLVAGDARQRAATCALSDEQTRWTQTALDMWQTASVELLQLPAAPLPRIVLVDTTCTFHLAPDAATRAGRALGPTSSPRPLVFAGKSVPIRAVAHGDSVILPNGATLAVRGMAFTSLYDERRPFFLVALPGVWPRDARYAHDTTDWADFALGVMTHEMVHTRQLASIAQRLEDLQRRYPDLPEAMDDDMVQRRFSSKAGADSSIRAEVSILLEAAAEPDAGRRSRLTARALDALQARRCSWYRGVDAPYAELEDLYLDMEGVASWTAYEMARRRAPHESEADVLDRFRDNRRWWSQEEGLALYLLLGLTTDD
jgi:hypothetical protein